MGPPAQLRNLSHKGSAARATPRSISSAKGGSATTFNVNFGTARPPTRTYSAETCLVQFRNGEVHFIFGQRKLVGDSWDSAISLRMHGSFARQFLKSVSMMEPTLDYILEASHLQVEPLDTLTQEPQSIAKMSANVVQVAVSGPEASLDFYQISPIAVMKAKQSKRTDDIELTPIARVDVRTALFASLIAELNTLEPQFSGINFEELEHE